MADQKPNIQTATLEQLLQGRERASQLGIKGKMALDQIDRALAERFEYSVEPNVVRADAPAEQGVGAGYDYGMGIASGLARTVAGTIDLPANITGLARKVIQAGYEKITGEPLSEEFVSRALSPKLPLIGDVSKAKVTPIVEEIAPDFLGYEPERTGAEYAQRVAEFAPFAGKNIVTQGILPAVASKFAGEVEGIEGTNLQLPVEVATAILTPTFAKRMISPSGGKITGETKRAVDLLKKEGVFPTAAQTTGSKQAAFLEQSTDAGMDLVEQSQRNFTKAALKRIGINSDEAAPELMERAYNDLGASFNKTIGSVTGRATKRDVDDLAEALSLYKGQAGPAVQSPIFSEMYQAFLQSARTKQPLSNNQIKRFHQTLNNMTRRGDEGGDAARSTIGVVKDLIGRNLGKEGAEQWREANRKYRDFLSIEDALSKAGDATKRLITPQGLRASTKSVFGKRAYVFGKSDLAELAKAGSVALKPLPSSGTTERLLAQGAGGSATGFGGYALAQSLGLGPEAQGVLALGGMAVPKVMSAATTTQPGQAYLKNQMVKELGQQNLLRMLAASTVQEPN